MRNYFKDLKDKIVLENKQKTQEQEKRKNKLRELEESQSQGITNPIKAIQTKKEIKKLKKEIEKENEKSNSLILTIVGICAVISLIGFACIMGIVENKTDTSSNTNETTSIITEQGITELSAAQEDKSSSHTHSYESATCTKPATCSICGETQGNSLEHIWAEATCTVPKTCTLCGETMGTTIAHDFVDEACRVCGKDNPDYIYEFKVWIPTNGGTKYHSRSNCSNMDNPKQVTISEAESRGFAPCQRCQ